MPDQAYVAEMWLTCDSTDPVVLAKFDQRWTQQVERDWSSIVVAYDNSATQAALRSALHDLIVGHYTAGPDYWIQEDLMALDRNYTYDSVEPIFSGDIWSGGTGGAHEATGLSINVRPRNAGPQRWRVDGLPGAYIRANCRWSIENVIP